MEHSEKARLATLAVWAGEEENLWQNAEGLLRYPVRIEDADDLIADLQHALSGVDAESE